MDTSTKFAIASISIGILYLIINNWILTIRQRSVATGFAKGQKEVIRSLKSTAFWFNDPEYKKEFNAMMLYSIIYDKYGSVDSDMFRKKIKELGTRKLKDLSSEEIENLIR